MKSIKCNSIFDVPKNYTGHVIFPAFQWWLKDGKLHREDGPAIIRADGRQEWCLDDRYYSKEIYYRALYKRGIITKEELFIELL